MIKLSLLNQTLSTLEVKIIINPTLKLDKKATMQLIINKQKSPDNYIKKQTHLFSIPFPTEYLIKHCDPQSNYKLTIRLENAQQNYIFCLFSSTLCDPFDVPVRQKKIEIVINQSIKSDSNKDNQMISQSENHLLNLMSAEDTDIKYFENKQHIQQTILKARKNQSSQAFINSDYKISRPLSLRKERFRRVWMVSKGYQLYDDLYSHQKEGHDFMKNDWFMGPFYSYDRNAKDLATAKQEQLDQENK